MVRSNLIDSNVLRHKTLKNLTSLKIIQQKSLINSQMKADLNFVERAQIDETLNFLRISKFVVCVRFLETEAFKASDLLSIVNSVSGGLASVKGFHSCNSLTAELNTEYSDFTELLVTSNSLFFLSAPSLPLLIKLVKTLVSVEENVGLGAMLSLCFVKDTDLIFDLRLNFPGSGSARSFFKTYDSRESILLELVKLTFSLPHTLLTSVGGEIVSPTSYGVGVISSEFWIIKNNS